MQKDPATEPLWQNSSGQAWVAMQTRTDVQLAPFGLAAMDRLSLESGQRVLDVGCGCGQTLLELALRVGATGRVLGVDVSEPMLARAREQLAETGTSNVDVALADAETHAISEASQDAVFSRFGVMFFKDSLAAFRNFRRALRPGGKIAFVCWQALERNPWAKLPLAAAQSVVGSDELPAMMLPGEPGPFRFGERATVIDLLQAAGFVEVAVEDIRQPMHVSAAMTLSEAVAGALQIGPAARLLADVSDELRARAADALGRVFEPFISARGLWMDAAAYVVTARR